MNTRINQQGFRDASTYSAVAQAGVTRILLLGHSFTFGASNRYEEIWPVTIESGLRDAGHRVEIIKAGVPAYDTRLEVLYLERLVDLYHPDLVVVGFLPNDLFTNTPTNEGNIEDLPENSLQSEGDRLQRLGVIAAGDKKSDLQSLILAKRLMMMNDELYAKLYLLTPRGAFFSSPPTDLLKQQINVTRSLLLRAKQFCEKKGCELMVISIPQQFQVIAAAKRVNTENIDPGYIDSALGQTAKDWGVQSIPLLPVLTEAYDATGQDLITGMTVTSIPTGTR